MVYELLDEIRNKVIGRYLVCTTFKCNYRYFGQVKKIEINTQIGGFPPVLFFYNSLNRNITAFINDKDIEAILNDDLNNTETELFLFDSESDAKLFMEMKNT